MFEIIKNVINNLDQSLNKDKFPFSTIAFLALIVLMIIFSLFKKNYLNEPSITSHMNVTHQEKNIKSN